MQGHIFFCSYIHFLIFITCNSRVLAIDSLLVLVNQDHHSLVPVTYTVSLGIHSYVPGLFDLCPPLGLGQFSIPTARIQLIFLGFQTAHLSHLVTHSWIFHSRFFLYLSLPGSKPQQPHHRILLASC